MNKDDMIPTIVHLEIIPFFLAGYALLIIRTATSTNGLISRLFRNDSGAQVYRRKRRVGQQ